MIGKLFCDLFILLRNLLSGFGAEISPPAEKKTEGIRGGFAVTELSNPPPAHRHSVVQLAAGAKSAKNIRSKKQNCHPRKLGRGWASSTPHYYGVYSADKEEGCRKSLYISCAFKGILIIQHIYNEDGVVYRYII